MKRIIGTVQITPPDGPSSLARVTSRDGVIDFMQDVKALPKYVKTAINQFGCVYFGFEKNDTGFSFTDRADERDW